MEFLPFPADPGFPDPHPYTGRTSAGGTSQGPGKRESAGPGHPTDLGRAEGGPGKKKEDKSKTEKQGETDGARPKPSQAQSASRLQRETH